MGSALLTEQPQAEAIATTLGSLATPCLILDADRMARNIVRLRTRLDGLGVSLRPHLKTAKSMPASIVQARHTA